MNGVVRLPKVVEALNNEVTRLIKMKPAEAIDQKIVNQGFSLPVKEEEEKLEVGTNVRYLYQPGELGGGQRRATDPIWSIKVYKIKIVSLYK